MSTGDDLPDPLTGGTAGPDAVVERLALRTELEGLKEEATEVSKTRQSLPEVIRALDRRTLILRRLLIVGLMVLGLDLGFTGLGGWLLYRDNQLTQQVHAQQDAAARLRHLTLCPLFDILLSTDSAQARDTAPRGTAWYDDAFHRMHVGYTALDCAH